MTRQKQSPNGRATSHRASMSFGFDAGHVPLAIIGIGCRYPGVSNPEQLWQKLMAGEELVRPYAQSRFADLDAQYADARDGKGPLRTDRGGFLEDVAGFDSQFFEISPREAVYLDPQQRLLLEVAWEALEDAGQVRGKYDNSLTGVYVGLWTSEYEKRLYNSATERNLYSVTGCGRASASGRLSFAFGFEGPSVTVDTACSSSLVAIYMGCQALWARQIDMAVAGGANLILGTEISEMFTKANMLSVDGRCKFGDAAADGFVRSEGAGVVVLKTLSRALADGDPIYALIRGGAVNNDGRGSGFMTPSSEGQQRMLGEAWKSARIKPADIRFIEMHGTGTSVGDPVEIGAVGAALQNAGLERPCLLGSVKTNLGHTESASGVTGLIKAALALKHRTLPPSLHLAVPNPKISWRDFPVQISREVVDLAAEPSPLIAGVNSFGLSGTNAHIVLEAVEHDPLTRRTQSGACLLPISARTTDALREMINAHVAAANDVGYSVRDTCYTAGARRTHHEHRIAIFGENLEDLQANLAVAATNEENESVVLGQPLAGERKIVFIAPGQGSQWTGMARELFAQEEVFRLAFQDCDDAIAAETGWTLADRMLGPDAKSHLVQIDVIQPALFTLSVCLAALWRSWGIEPDAVVGHSMGEVAAAHIAGILSLKDAAAVICRRSRLMKTLRGEGSMATVELSLPDVEMLLASRGGISIGASNGPSSTVISGDAREIDVLLKELEAKEIYCRLVKVDVASHSAQVDPILSELKTALADIRPRPATLPMLSTVTGKYANDSHGHSSGTTLDAAYWAGNLRKSVLYAPAIEKLCAAGNDIFIELSPHPILLPSTEASARPVNPRIVAVASLRREKSERATMLRGLGALYVAGCHVAWERVYRGGRCVSLPQYAFQRERYWPEPFDPEHGSLMHFEKSNSLLGHQFESALHPNVLLWESKLQIANCPYLNDHRVLRSAVFPASGHLAMALSAIRSLFPGESYEIEKAFFLSAAYIPDQGSKTLQIALLPEMDGRFSFEIRTRADEGEAPWPLRSKGVLHRTNSGMASESVPIERLRQCYTTHLSEGDHYERTAKSGLQYGSAFRLVEEAWVGSGESLCRLRNCGSDPGSLFIHPALLDACFQAMAHIRPETEAFKATDTYLPVAIERLCIHSPIPNSGDLFAQANLTHADSASGTLHADLKLTDESGKLLLNVVGMELMRVARENLSSMPESLHEMVWVSEGLQESNAAKAERMAASMARLANLTAENWLIFADQTGIANTMVQSLRVGGGHCTIVRHGQTFTKIADDVFEIDPQSGMDFDRLFAEVSQTHGVPTAVVHLWSVDAGSNADYDADRLIRSQTLGIQCIPWIVQAIGRKNWERPSRLWLVTAGAMQVGRDDNSLRIESAPIWGIGRSVAREHPELHVSLVDLSRHPDDREARALAYEVCASGKEDRVALRGQQKYVARIKPLRFTNTASEAQLLKPEENYRLEISQPGIIDNIELRERACVPPQPGEINVSISEAGLNFSDVTKVMGLYPGLIAGQPIPLGNEAVGTVTAVGAGVDTFQIGDSVITLTPNMRTIGMMASSVSVPAILAVHKPTNLTDEQAATMTVVYATAYWSLIDQARIRAGEWILIHAAAGGVGLAAIEIAKWAGANVIATVGSKEKEDYVRALGVKHVLSSRSIDFVAGVMKITEGRGVDIVLNSLAGEFLLKSLEVLAPYGRFVELGKRDVHGDSRVGLRVLRNNNSFHVVDVASAVEDRQSYMAEILAALVRRFESGEWKPLPVTSFNSTDPSIPFRFMAQAKHIGKISIRMGRDVRVLPPPNCPLFSAKASYLITGGLGGIALTVAEWMASSGAGHIVLLSRRVVSEESSAAIRRMEEAGAKVTVVRGDVTHEADVTNALEVIRISRLPLKGIMHTAAVVDDALVANLTSERFLPVLAPKIIGAWNLHTATRTAKLDFFVLFSSIAAIHPQPGMGSYAAANAFLDAFAHYLRGAGYPAISVNWGGWDQIGLARAAGTGRSIEGYGSEGMRVFSAEEALNALRQVLEKKPVQVAAVPIDAAQFSEFHSLNEIPPAFADLISQLKANGTVQPSRSETVEQLAAADSSTQRAEVMEAHLQDVLGRVLKLASHRIDRHRALGSMGLDSLMGLEFVRRLSHSLDIAVPATVVFNYPTIRLLAAHLLQRMHLDHAIAPAAIELNRSEVSNLWEQSLSELDDVVSEEDALHALMGNESGSS